jgi:hypothetical protein
MSEYHLRRADKQISEPNELKRILSTQRYMTVAMCRGTEPYLVTMNHAFDELQNCLYFHCASEGKKLEVLGQNETVWGQVMEDHGYIQGQCDHAYMTVHFRGRVQLLKTAGEKKHALSFMIDRLEDRPDERKTNLIGDGKLEKVTVGKIMIESMTGKANLPKPGV